MAGGLQAPKIPRWGAIAMPTRWGELTPKDEALIRSWPPVALVASPVLAKALGVSTSTLRNWRFRKQGPQPEPAALYGRSAPYPIYYRVSSVLAWLDQTEALSPWKYERDWLAEHLNGWRFVDDFGQIDISAQMTPYQTSRALPAIRTLATDLLFNDAAAIRCWPNRQPTGRQCFSHAT